MKVKWGFLLKGRARELIPSIHFYLYVILTNFYPKRNFTEAELSFGRATEVCAYKRSPLLTILNYAGPRCGTREDVWDPATTRKPCFIIPYRAEEKMSGINWESLKLTSSI